MEHQENQSYQKSLSLSKANLILIVLLNACALFLFFNFQSLQKRILFNEKRIDELEKRPLLLSQNSPVPEAGESGRVVLPFTPVPTPFTALLTTPVPSSPTPTKTPVPTAAPLKVSYLPIYGGGAQTTDTNWVDVVGSDFQLKSQDYGSSSYFTWEAIAFLIGGSGEARLRVYDLTNNVVVSGSEISLTAVKPTLVMSGRLNFFAGNNTYRVQLSSLTSSTAEFDFGRVKVVY